MEQGNLLSKFNGTRVDFANIVVKINTCTQPNKQCLKKTKRHDENITIT